MSSFSEEIMDSIAEKVLINESGIDSALYKNRLRLLYSVILEEMIVDSNEEKLEGLVRSIISYELEQIYSTEINIKQYNSITSTRACSLFSTTAFNLAVERLKGNDYHDLAELLLVVFRGLIESTSAGFDKMEISEALLDFDFARGKSMVMSLRLKRQHDAMN